MWLHFFQAANLMTHLKHVLDKSQTNTTSLLTGFCKQFGDADDDDDYNDANDDHDSDNDWS